MNFWKRIFYGGTFRKADNTEKKSQPPTTSSKQESPDEQLALATEQGNGVEILRLLKIGARIEFVELLRAEPLFREQVAARDKLRRELMLPSKDDPTYKGQLSFCPGWQRAVVVLGDAAEELLQLCGKDPK
ncbi:MAG: hypothetical protein ABSG78_06500 [Verrucomicrobiota bacterium]|jgi:hypothetical protein